MYKEVKKIKTKTVKETRYKPSYDGDDDSSDDDEDSEVPEGIDIVLVDVPLMIRLLEYARESATSDVDLHNLATKLVTKSNKWKSWKPLTMADYASIVPPATETVEATT